MNFVHWHRIWTQHSEKSIYICRKQHVSVGLLSRFCSDSLYFPTAHTITKKNTLSNPKIGSCVDLWCCYCYSYCCCCCVYLHRSYVFPWHYLCRRKTSSSISMYEKIEPYRRTKWSYGLSTRTKLSPPKQKTPSILDWMCFCIFHQNHQYKPMRDFVSKHKYISLLMLQTNTCTILCECACVCRWHWLVTFTFGC